MLLDISRYNFSAYKKEFAALVALALPMLLSQVAQVGTGFVDTVMAGSISTSDLSAVGLGNSVFFTVYITLLGVMTALNPMISQAFGVHKHKNTNDTQKAIGNLGWQGIWYGLFLGVIGLFLVWSVIGFFDKFLNYLENNKYKEKYFEENNVVYDENYIYAVKRERNLNALLMSGLLGLIFKTGVQPYYILFRDDEILFFKVGAFGGIKEFSFRIRVDDIKSIVLKKGVLNYKLVIKIELNGKLKKEIINFLKINGKAWWIQNRNNLVEGGYFDRLKEKVESRNLIEG